MGDSRAEGSSATGDGEQAAISLMPDVEAQVLVPCWIKFCLKNHLVLTVISSLFLIIGDTVALDCILNGCCKLHALFYVRILCLKNQQCLLR